MDFGWALMPSQVSLEERGGLDFTDRRREAHVKIEAEGVTDKTSAILPEKEN